VQPEPIEFVACPEDWLYMRCLRCLTPPVINEFPFASFALRRASGHNLLLLLLLYVQFVEVLLRRAD